MAFTADDRQKLKDAHKKLGLALGDPWNVSWAAKKEYSDSLDIEIVLSGDGDDTATESRQ